jgi:hypothetical protein
VQFFERTRLISLYRVIGLVVAGVVWLLAGGTSWAAISTFTAVADTEVRSESPNKNFGRATTLSVGGSPVRNAYLRFNVSIPAGEVVTNATVRLFSTSGSSAEIFIHQVASTTWGETSTRYSNAPAIGALLAASGPYPANAYVPVNVTQLVNGNGLVSIAIRRTSASATSFNSREAFSNRPQLVVESAWIPDTAAPTVAMTAPASGAAVSGASVAVSASASDNVEVAGVQFKLDGANLGAEDTAAPYTTNWNTTAVSNGSHTLSAVARDAAANTANASDVVVMVSNVSVAMTAPASGATVSGPSVTVSANASDNVVAVQFKLDGGNLGAEDTAAPYTIVWDTTAVSNGSHALSAVARGTVGNTASSSQLTVNVTNLSPPPAGEPPTVSADALPTWQINGVVWSQVVVNNIVYATGSFTKARPPGVPVGGAGEIDGQNIFAYDVSTGERVAWFNHSLNAQGLGIAASPDGSRVYVVGDFTAVDGVARIHAASFRTATGTLDPDFNPKVQGLTQAVAATNSIVYLGGAFNLVNGKTRAGLAAVDAISGTELSWAPAIDSGAGSRVRAMVLSPDQSRVIVGGSFTAINGQAAFGMGSVDAVTGANLPWAANQKIRDAGENGGIVSLRADNAQIYGSGYSFNSGSNIQTNFEGTFAANPTTGAITVINDCHGDTYDVLPLGSVLYSVGHAHDCRWVRSFPDTSPRVRWQRALAQTIFPTTTNIGPDNYGWNYNGMPASTILHWFPQLTAGTYTGTSQAAWSLAGNSNYVALGGEFSKVNGLAQQGLVRMAIRAIAPNSRGPSYTTNPARPVPPTIATSTSSGTVNVSFGTAWDYDDESLKYEVFRNGKGTPVHTTNISSNFWTLPTASYTDTLAPGTTLFYQIRITDPYGNTQWSLKSDTITVCCTGGAAAAAAAVAALADLQATEASNSAALESVRASKPVGLYVDPQVRLKYQPVLRGKKVPGTIVPASAVRLFASAAVRYSDRVLVSITKIVGGKEKGSGPGIFPGRPYAAISIRLTNHSPAALDLNQVVVSTQYGSPARLAAAVYNDASARDFFGILKPGGSATATYLFAIPPQNRGNVVTIVDFDSAHAPATFNSASR